MKSILQKVCVAISCILGLLAMFWWHVLPLPSSPEGSPMNLSRSLTVIGYSYLFVMIGNLVAAPLQGLYSAIARKSRPGA